ncbi:hypothetical protein KPL76_01790 [Subtercola sp. PAMC28395]|uniref:hypothetical protein n=1 Tax=Subtercola sp. PAMC28395 TaxID=2846775 RepID=UPI001C0ACB7D|nr:hypothetical protein [Subtercola sp. PAMC28395]QWT24190.1 hypothetical protein KPL76_01790 [Subtercola sp. PAMC28395]
MSNDDGREPDDSTDAGENDAADAEQKRRRLLYARLVVAGVGLTFLIVGFVQFVTK